ncbi:MAG TPA: FAD-dependent oxidoreductase [Nevskiaceae bacterium]|nr:FAD-dependent oxidoreductase [Nevskiaceae bacterium]
MYDVLIIGSGPAGLTASIYASRYKLSNLVIGRVLGGMMTSAHKIENYPGFASISGAELSQKMGEHVKTLGAEILADGVSKIEKTETGFKVTTENGQDFEGKVLIVATGTERRKLDVPGEKEYLGRGVSYCTACDIPFFKDKIVALIGGSDAAVSGAIHATAFVKKAYIIYRREKLRAEPVWVEEVLKNPKIEVIYKTNITEILGDGTKVTGVKLDSPHQGTEKLTLDGVFIEIGGVPGTQLLKPLGVELDEGGFVKVKPDMSTNITGVFAAGDIANIAGEFQQIVTAASEGAMAAFSAFKYLKGAVELPTY